VSKKRDTEYMAVIKNLQEQVKMKTKIQSDMHQQIMQLKMDNRVLKKDLSTVRTSFAEL